MQKGEVVLFQGEYILLTEMTYIPPSAFRVKGTEIGDYVRERGMDPLSEEGKAELARLRELCQGESDLSVAVKGRGMTF